MSPVKKDMRWVNVTDDFKNILSKINDTRANLFITGKAGTGKSTLLKYFYNQTDKSCVLLAPTGRAAINIGGQTLHSFFDLGWGVLDPNDYLDKICKASKNVDLIIIDEISMVRADILDCIDKILKCTMNNNEPFGDKQVVFFGDPYQLPPIVGNDPNIIEYFSNFYESPYFFHSNSYMSAGIVALELTKVFRQIDQDFIGILNRIRTNDYTKEDLSQINKQVDTIDLEGKHIILTPYRDRASQINQMGLDSIDSKMHSFEAKLTGKTKESSVPAEMILNLKVGAKVMFVKNDHPKWVNGNLGTVLEVYEDSVLVDKSGSKYEVMVDEWEEYRYVYDEQTGQLNKEVIGTFQQIPLILAWAVTIHKSQGSTLDRICLDLDRGAFSFGQTYVGLSRTSSLSDIILTKPITSKDIKVDQIVINYYKSISDR